MAILALETDPVQASTIRHIVRDVLRTDLKLVGSMSELLRTLGPDIPDLILLPALLPPADEAVLLGHLSTLQNSGHLELLITPILSAPEKAPAAGLRGWRKWRAKTSKSRSQAPTCDPLAFAEHLTWSLQRVQEVREARTEPRALTLPVSAVELVTSSVEDRRAHQRFPAGLLQGLRTARIKHGPLVRLVDCSAGGALVESEVPLRPDSEAVLELISDGRQSVVPFRVVRCQASVVESRLLYWGACAFSQPLEVADLLQAPTADMPAPAIGRFDSTVREIVERYLSVAESEVGSLRTLQAEYMTELATSLRELGCSRRDDSVARAINGLLTIVVAKLEDRDERADTLDLIEKQLEAALPSLTARFAAAPTPAAVADSECLYLAVPAPGDAVSSVLNVELPQGSILEEWQFRLLKASTYVAALLHPVSEMETNRLVMFEGRRVGAPTVADSLRKEVIAESMIA